MPLYVSTPYKLLTLYLGSAFQRTGRDELCGNFTLAKIKPDVSPDGQRLA